MLLSIILGFIGGVWVGSLFHFGLSSFVFVSLVLIVVFSYRYFVEEDNKKILNLIAVFLLFLILGIARVSFSDLHKESQLTPFANQKINVEGIVVNEPDIRERNTKLTVRLDKIILATTTISVREKILVTVPLHPEFTYGDRVSMSVTLVEPSKIESSNGHIFDYQNYLRVRSIWFTSRFTSIKLLSHDNGSLVKTWLFKTKNVFTESLENILPSPHSALMAGLLLGTKQSLGEDWLEKFRKTGVSHIVVLSGYNIAIVAESIISAFKFLPKNFSFGFGVLSIILFAILSGGGASVTRASIMVLVALYAKHTNRDYKASRILGLTVAVMLLPNPLFLVYDPSFQLSILATIGLVFVSPVISPYLTRITERFGLREIVSSTIATQLTVLPFLIYNMGLLSLVSLPVNVLILSTIPLTMLLGFITGIVGIFSFYLSFIPAFFTYILLWYQLTMVNIGASIPFSAINLPAFSPIIMILIYVIIFYSLYFLKKKK